ncbi:MAG: glyoxalase [Acidimicrobiales bacterium]
MELGAFSVSLAVADLAASQRFYEALGFTVTGGDAGEHWLIMVNGTSVIGLFEGMFDSNILTFNPGLGRDLGPVDPFDDVRTIEAHLVAHGIEPVSRVDPESTEGPASLTLRDPDGNMILIDQFR